MTTLDHDHSSSEDMSESQSEIDEEEQSLNQQDEEDDTEAATKTSKNKSQEKAKKPSKQSDVQEGRTIFIRNLSFDTTEKALKSYFTLFGEVEYALICKDKITDHSKGTAFVKFQSASSATAVLDKQKEDPHSIFLDDRRLIVDYAIDRNNLSQQLEQQKSQKRDRDKRNLYLAREGVIYAGSPAAQDVSPADLEKRLALEVTKRKALQLTTNFVSRTRLCIHNIPESYDDKKLKKLFESSVDDKSAVIIECRIMRNRAATGKLTKSKGFGFVEFKEHQHALSALRKLNNNPSVFSASRRPIVEFAIEDKMKLNAKKKRLEKAEKVRQEKIAENANLQPIAKKNPAANDNENENPESGKSTNRKKKWREHLKKIKAQRMAKRAEKGKETGISTSDSMQQPEGNETKENDNDTSGDSKKKPTVKSSKKSKTNDDDFSGIRAEPAKPSEKIAPPKINRKVTESRKLIKEKARELKEQMHKEKIQAIHDKKRQEKIAKRKEANKKKKEQQSKIKDFDDFEESFLKKTSGTKTLTDKKDSRKVVNKKKKWFSND